MKPPLLFLFATFLAAQVSKPVGKFSSTITDPTSAEFVTVERKLPIPAPLPLPASAEVAVEYSTRWINDSPSPTASLDSRVLYTYGRGVPTVVCAILQLCEIDLEAGETLSKDSLDWGDPRFKIVARTAGSGSGEFTYLVLKPTEAGLDTTMTVGTNRRPYYVRLVSTAHDHLTRVAFLYPDDEAAKRATQDALMAAEQKSKADEAERLAKLNTAKPMKNWNYTVKLHGADAAYLKPESIADDGNHTYIQFSELTRRRGLPVVQLSDARGTIPANAHWKDNQLVIDSLFQHACLIEGVGKKQQRACITNSGLQPNILPGEPNAGN